MCLAISVRAQQDAPPTPGQTDDESVTHTYAEQSVLSSGRWIKVRIEQSGLYKISYETLQQQGIDPNNARVFGYGGAMLQQSFLKAKKDDLPEVASYQYKGADNIFNQGDYLIFYAQGPISWAWTGTRLKHTINPYSQYGYYFITSDAGTNKRIEKEANQNTEYSATVTTFQDYKLHELELINLNDRTGKAGAGREFYGEEIGAKKTLTLDFDFPNIVGSEQMSVVTSFVNTATEATTCRVSINGETVQTLSLTALKAGDFNIRGIEKSAFNQFYSDGSRSQRLSLTYNANSTAATGFLNYIELSACRQLRLNNGVLYFNNTKNLGKQYVKYVISGCNSNTHIWNITDPTNAYEVDAQLSNDELSFVEYAETLQQYVAITIGQTDIPEPTIIGLVGNQNLHSLRGIEYVVITNEAFLSQANALANAHSQYDGLTVAVVTDQQVFNEFSSGTPDATAFRWLMKMLYDRSKKEDSKAPRYLQLVGDGTFDNRKLLKTSGNNFILTYQAVNSLNETASYASDDYFCFLDDNEGSSDMSSTMEISVGRLPVNNETEANSIVNKLVHYIQNPTYGNWKNQLIFLGDDGDNGIHLRCADRSAELVRTNNKNFVVNKIFLDAYQQEVTASGERYPLAQNRLQNLLSKGSLFFNYSGHASYTNITSENILHVNDIRQMTNKNQGLWMFVTCNFSQFDATTISAGEESILNPNGGALCMFSSCRTVFASENEILNKYVCEALFANRNNPNYSNTIGDAIRIGKNQQLTTENKLPYILLGDPAIRLHYPTDYTIQTDSITSQDARQDTIKALSINTIKGKITTHDNQPLTDFNGKIQITIYDKMQQVSTSDNDESDPDKKFNYRFNDYPNTLYNGEVDVVDGEWECTFMMPKDIKYNYGAGRIVYYAYDSINGYEANGYYEDFVIGGSSDYEITDTQGPDIQLYLENPNFQDGGKVSEQPRLFAHIYDENGINTIGIGIGHDILLTIDADPNQSYIMNDYFVAQSNSYQAGDISYRLLTLPDGNHSLTLRAWDLLNNSTTARLNFGVVTGLDPVIFSVLTYPNPITTDQTLCITIQHDRPDAIHYLEIEFYDLNGKKQYTYSQQGAEQVRIPVSGCHLSSGMYIYRVKIKTATSEYVSQNGKLIIK